MKIIKVRSLTITLNNFFLAWLMLYLAVGMLIEGLIGFAVVLIHELCHLFAARRLGEQVEEVELLPFGGVAKLKGNIDLNPGKECLIAAAGPLANISMIIAALSLNNNGIYWQQYADFFIQINAVMILFNLLPALPLDGGRIYRALKAENIGLKKATDRASLLGQLMGAIIFFAGIIGLYYRVIGLDIIVSGLFLFYAASRERRASAFIYMRCLNNKKFELEQIGILPVSYLAVYEQTTVKEVLDMLLPRNFHLVMVLDSELNCLQILSEADIIEAMLSPGMNCPVGAIKKCRI